MQTVMTEHDIL
ncbi:Protein of unknown function [Leuconostoc citreum]|nr:Protein of unknown function [Leuconostoc citreum LBAE C11]CDX64235.1 Protein of unknown function [Leuconostoc citreum]CDX65956.1 Protein of unknown function [Leuconostoc citreum]